MTRVHGIGNGQRCETRRLKPVVRDNVPHVYTCCPWTHLEHSTCAGANVVKRLARDGGRVARENRAPQLVNRLASVPDLHR